MRTRMGPERVNKKNRQNANVVKTVGITPVRQRMQY